MKKFVLLFLLCSTFFAAQNNALRKQINTITKGKNSTIAVSVKGIDFPFQFDNSNASKKLPMPSVFKFHIACAVLHQVDEGKLNLNQKILIRKSDLLENTWSPIREKYPNGNIELSLDEILKYTVSQSDNNGCDILLRLIGGTKAVQELMNSKGIKNFQIKYNEEEMHKGVAYLYQNYTTTKSLTSLLKAFYQKEIISSESTDYLYQIMLQTSTGINKLKEQLSNGIVAHKTGSSGKVGNLTIAENDAGIVTLPNGKKYSIAVFISDSTEDEVVNCKIISDISKIVYDDLSNVKSGFFFYTK